MCEEEAASLPLDWAEYREPGTQFIKASTSPESIAEQLATVFNMPSKQRAKMVKKGREWVEKNFSVESVGGFIEEFIDNAPKVEFDFSKVGEKEERDPHAFVPQLQSDKDWVLALYKNILKMYDVDSDNEGFLYWMEQIKKGASREEVEKYFRQVALKENSENEWDNLIKNDLKKLLGEDDEGKRIVYVMPESIGDVFLSTSLFRSLKETYPDYNLYVSTKPQFHSVLNGNPYVYKVIPYLPEMENILFLEGKDNHKGFFEIAFLPFAATQRQMTYPHNGKDKIAFSDYKYT